MWPVPCIAQVTHQALQHPRGLLHIRQAFIGIETMPFPMLPFPHGGIRKPVTFFGLSSQVKGLLPVLFHRAQKPFRRQVCTGKTEAVQLCLQQHGILKKDFAPAGHSRPHEPAFLQIAFIAPLCPQAQTPVPLRLSPERFRFCRPKQFFFPVRRINYFGRIFRRLEGLPPRAFAEQYRLPV